MCIEDRIEGTPPNSDFLKKTLSQALEMISMALKLTPDVAGATFLAAGSSAPELFTALSDTFGSQNSIGTGTIVG